MADDTTSEITEENTAPDAQSDVSPADSEVGETDVNFTTDAGTQEEPASLSDGMGSDLDDSATSPSDPAEETYPDATGSTDPLGSGAIGDSPDAPDASNSDTGLGNAVGTTYTDAAKDDDALASLQGEHADGEGVTHVGTDTPEKLISNPYNEDTGEALFGDACHSDEPLNFNSFSDKDEGGGAKGKCDEAIALMTEVGNNL